MNKECTAFFTLINEKIDGTLTPEQEGELKNHLDTCEDCQKLHESLKNTVSSLHSLKNLSLPPADIDFSRSIMQKIKADSGKTSVVKLNFFKYAVATILFVGLALAILPFFNVETKLVNTQQAGYEPVKVANYPVDIDSLFAEDDYILSDAGLPTDEWGLIDIDRI